MRGNLNGPLGKRSSFFLSANRNYAANNAVIKAITLDANQSPFNFTQAIPNPVLNEQYSIRIDRQFGAKDTFIGRYTFANDNLTAIGVGLFTLPSAGVSSDTHTHTLQLSDTHIFSPKVILDSAYQYTHAHLQQDPTSNAPSIIVQGAFNGGGSQAQSLQDTQDRLELQEYFSISHGTHFIRTGLRYRLLHETNAATAGYNGQFIFPSLAAYQATQQALRSNTPSANCTTTSGVKTCSGPTQFSISAGTSAASLTMGDLGLYAEDEWKATPNFTINYGLRFETQSAIRDHFDLAPRVAVAYSIAPNKKTKQPAAVLRAGVGMFYQRFAANDLLQSIRQNGTTQQVYLVTNPTFYCDPSLDTKCAPPTAASIPTANATSPTIYELNPRLRSPQTIQSMISVEHAFGKIGTVTTSFYLRRSLHQFESINANAPLPGTYNAAIPGSGLRPQGGSAKHLPVLVRRHQQRPHLRRQRPVQFHQEHQLLRLPRHRPPGRRHRRPQHLRLKLL